jgi:uncharacterized Fe-S cluster protein YjdI
MTEKNRDYSNGEITIHWQPDKCIHSANCIRTLPGVFNPNERPWIKIKNADTAHLIEAVEKCPSGALTYTNDKIDDAGPTDSRQQMSAADNAKVCIFKDGPIEIKGNFEMTDVAGNVVSDMDKIYLCRCGHSQNKPFCDGAHKKMGFTD